MREKKEKVVFFEKFKNQIFKDKRGFLKINFEINGMSFKESFSKKNVFRGLHVQVPPFTQTKFIWIEKGCVMDIALNLDKKSNTYGKIKTLKINSKSGIYKISQNFAHGFLSLKPTKFRYICLGDYKKKYEKTISLNKEFFHKLGFKNIIFSDKDANGLQIGEALEYFKSVKW